MKYEFQTDYRLERFVLRTQWKDLPEEIRKRAIVCGIDLMIALLLGSRGNQFRAGCTFAEKYYQHGDIPVVGSEKTFNLPGAVVAMSHASNSFDIDDGHNMIKGHPGTSFVAGVLSAALAKQCSYEEYLAALAVTYEVTIRFGLAEQDHYGYLHSTGTYGAFGTAAGMGRLLGFTEKQLNNALSVADFHAPLTPVMRSVQYPSMNKDGVPFGALVGMQAVLETLCGTTGVGNILELPAYKKYIDSLGREYEIMNLYFKPFTCCRWAHQPIQACIDLKAQEGFAPEDIDHAVVHTFDSAAQLSKIIPHTTDEAQYNIAWPVASALVFGDVGIAQVIESALDNEDVIRMMDRLQFTVDPEMDRQFPGKRLAWVEIFLKDGRCLKSKVYEADGEAKDHVDLEWMERKFRKRTQGLLTEAAQDETLDLLEHHLDMPINAVISHLNSLVL